MFCCSLLFSFPLSFAVASNSNEDLVMEEPSGSVVGFDFCWKYKDELEKNLKNIEDGFTIIEEAIKKNKVSSYQDLIEENSYLSGIQSARKSLDLHMFWIKKLNNNNNEDCQKMFITSIISQSVFIKNQCYPILPFIDKRSLLSEAAKKSFQQSLEEIKEISLKSFRNLYPKENQF